MSWRPLNSGDLSGVRRPLPSNETRARPDFDVLAIQHRPGFGDSFFHRIGNRPQQQAISCGLCMGLMLRLASPLATA